MLTEAAAVAGAPRIVRELVEVLVPAYGTRTAIARLLGVELTRLNDWQSGDRSMPDERLFALAQLAGLDPVQVIGRYRVERLAAEGHAGALGWPPADGTLAAVPPNKQEAAEQLLLACFRACDDARQADLRLLAERWQQSRANGS